MSESSKLQLRPSCLVWFEGGARPGTSKFGGRQWLGPDFSVDVKEKKGWWDFSGTWAPGPSRGDILRLEFTRRRMFRQAYKANYLMCAIVPSVMNKRRSISFCQGARGSGRARTYICRACIAKCCELEREAMGYDSSVVWDDDEAGEADTRLLEKNRWKWVSERLVKIVPRQRPVSVHTVSHSRVSQDLRSCCLVSLATSAGNSGQKRQASCHWWQLWRGELAVAVIVAVGGLI